MNHAINGMVDTFLSHFPEKKRDAEELKVRRLVIHFCRHAPSACAPRTFALTKHCNSVLQDMDARDTITFRDKAVAGIKRKRANDTGTAALVDPGVITISDSDGEDDDYDDGGGSVGSSEYDSDGGHSDDGTVSSADGGVAMAAPWDPTRCRMHVTPDPRSGTRCDCQPGHHNRCSLCFEFFPKRTVLDPPGACDLDSAAQVRAL